MIPEPLVRLYVAFSAVDKLRAGYPISGVASPTHTYSVMISVPLSWTTVTHDPYTVAIQKPDAVKRFEGGPLLPDEKGE